MPTESEANQSTTNKQLEGILRNKKKERGTLIDFNSIEVPKDNEEILDNESFYLNTIDLELVECLASLPPINPTTIENIVNHQSRDQTLRRAPLDNPDQYQHQEIQRMDIVRRTEGHNQWKIALP